MRNTNSAIFKAILNNYDLGQLISWRYPKGGALHDNIIIETTRGWFFLKYYRPDYHETNLHLQHKILLGLSSRNLPVPIPVMNLKYETYLKHQGRIIGLYNYIVGTPLNMQLLTDDFITEFAIVIANIHLELNDIHKGDNITRYKFGIDKTFSMLHSILEAITITEDNPQKSLHIGIIRESLMFLGNGKSFVDKLGEIPVQITHGDLNEGNILVDLVNFNDVRGIVDWEGIGVRPRIFDVSKFINLVLINSGDSTDIRKIALFSKQYVQSANLSNIEAELLFILYPIFVFCYQQLLERHYLLLDNSLDKYITKEHYNSRWTWLHNEMLLDLLFSRKNS